MAQELKHCILHGLHLLQAIKTELNDDAAVDAFNALQVILGRTWSSAIIFNRMQGTNKFVTWTALGLNMRINIIKEIRAMTGLGLKESKDITDRVAGGWPYTFDFSNKTDAEIDTFVNIMQSFGCVMSYS